jgi:hypothetical protein
MNTDDRPGMPPPDNQPPPQRQGASMPNMPNIGNMANMGKGNPYLVNADVRLNSLERLTVMLIRLAAWVALLVLAITLCVDFIRIFTGESVSFGGTTVSTNVVTFQGILNGFVNLLRTFAAGAIAAVGLLGLASIVESLVMMRHNRT